MVEPFKLNIDMGKTELSSQGVACIERARQKRERKQMRNKLIRKKNENRTIINGLFRSNLRANLGK